MKSINYVALSLLATSFQGCAQQNPVAKPNILWIASEDNSAYFTGCYGNSFATIPNIDKLASQGFLYTHAYCTNAVCTPSRNTIITGVYASSNGHEKPVEGNNLHTICDDDHPDSLTCYQKSVKVKLIFKTAI